MDWFSILVAAMVGILMAGFIAMLGVNIVQNLRRGEKYREGLARHVNRLRLGSMANRIGLSPVQLVHQLPVPELRNQIDRCQDCQHTIACDQLLAEAPEVGGEQHEAVAAVPGFCANSAQLEALSGELPATA